MFDANARHLPDGKLFFAECNSIDPDNTLLINSFLKEGETYFFEKIGKNPYECKFRVYKDTGKLKYLQLVVDFEDEENFDDYSLFVYSGRPDGTGFIDEEWRQKALDFLGGEWYA